MTTYIWGTNRPLNLYTAQLQKQFGCRVQKLSIDGGFTCPNRDGTLGFDGCIFCDNTAFTPAYVTAEKPIHQQLKEGMEFHSKRYKTEKYFAYFQSFSNTYAPLERLKEIYEEALSLENIIGLVIGTRPDCVDAEKLDYLAELSKKYYVLIEYGVESFSPQVLKTINRGHDLETSIRAIELTHQKGIQCGIHIIFGLPSESIESMFDMVKTINLLPISTIKFHQLQVVKGTRLELFYQDFPEQCLHFATLELYMNFFILFLEQLNPNIMVERVAGEVKIDKIIAPKWGNYRYDQILQIIEKEMIRRRTWQGRLYN